MDGGLGRRERERGIDRPLFFPQPSSRQEPGAHPPILLGRFQPPRPRRRRHEAPRGARRARRALDGGGARRGARTTSPSPPSLLPLSCPAPCAARHPLSRHKEGAAAERGALAEQEQGVARGGVVPAQGLDEVRVAGLGTQAAVQLGDQGGLRDVGGFYFFVFFRGWGTGGERCVFFFFAIDRFFCEGISLFLHTAKGWRCVCLSLSPQQPPRGAGGAAVCICGVGVGC